MTNAAETIGFIGLGNMGRPMALRLLAAGHALVVHDAEPSALVPLVEAGALASHSVLEVASLAETVFLSLPTPTVVEAVATRPGGLADLAGAGALRRIVDLSTTGRRAAERLAASFADRGVEWLDSPVSGGVAGARAGTVAVMFSGPRASFDALEPMLRAIGRPFYVGATPGLGQTMKLANNLLSATALALTSEAMVMGVKAGIAPRTMVDVINAGSGRNTATEQKFPDAILTGRFDNGFSTGLMHKDVALFVEEAEAMGLSLDGARTVLSLWQRALEALGSEADFTEVVKTVEAAAGVEVRDA